MNEWTPQAPPGARDFGPEWIAGAELDDLLVGGGDERIAIDPASGRNRYGGTVRPEDAGIVFSSSTISTISPEGYAAAAARLDAMRAQARAGDGYAEQLDAVRARLTELCELAPDTVDVILGASGTDLHLFAGLLARGEDMAPAVSVLGDPTESGRGVPLALTGRRYAAQSPHGGSGQPGEPHPDIALGELVTVKLREADGAARAPEAVDAEIEQACEAAIANGERVLLTMLDVSKTGLTAPSPACAARLKARHGEALTVLVDACQFRLSTRNLARYLELGFLVAVTGSKFIGGPPFSGALLAARDASARLRALRLPASAGEYAARADWPAGYAAREGLPKVANWGLLLRWEAALHELAKFRRLPEPAVEAFLREFGAAVEAKIAASPELERVSVPPAARPVADWDAHPTIFPFLLHGRAGVLHTAATTALYERLRHGARDRVALGQPVGLGVRDGRPISAVRLSIGAREIAEALASPKARAAVIERALRALDIVAKAARAA